MLRDGYDKALADMDIAKDPKQSEHTDLNSSFVRWNRVTRAHLQYGGSRRCTGTIYPTNTSVISARASEAFPDTHALCRDLSTVLRRQSL